MNVSYKKIGNNLRSSGYRITTTKRINGKVVRKLISWSNRKCEICKRFLSKKQQKYSAKCEVLQHRENTKEWKNNNPNN